MTDRLAPDQNQVPDEDDNNDDLIAEAEELLNHLTNLLKAKVTVPRAPETVHVITPTERRVPPLVNTTAPKRPKVAHNKPDNVYVAKKKKAKPKRKTW